MLLRDKSPSLKVALIGKLDVNRDKLYIIDNMVISVKCKHVTYSIFAFFGNFNKCDGQKTEC